MNSLSKLSSQNFKTVSCIGALAGVYYLYTKQRKLDNVKSVLSAIDLKKTKDNSKDKDKSRRISVDGKFLKKLYSILKILIPTCFSSEVFYLLLVAVSLISRTYCDVWMIKNGTEIESAIIGRNKKLFAKNLLQFVYAMPAISVVNNLLKYGLSELNLCFRTRLTNYLYKQYLNGYTFYKMSNLDNRIANPDQLLTQDVERFCESLVHLYSNVSKPILDIVLYVYTLTMSIGFQGPAVMLSYLVFSGFILTKLRQPMVKMTVAEQELEGEFRFINSRVIVNSEEIAFYQGHNREKTTLLKAFHRLIMHLRKLTYFRFSMGFMDNIVAKYAATIIGYFCVSRPFFSKTDSRLLGQNHKTLMEHYYKSGRMLVKLAEAIGRMALAGREMTKLAGYTARVTDFAKVLSDLNKGHYVRTMIDQQNDMEKDQQLNGKLSPIPLIPGSGRIVIVNNIIRFDNVPLVTPNGDVLLNCMNFEVRSGMNVLVCGPNGCGKSSLFRILGELWPLFGGVLTKPDKGKLFYVPQRPYMTIGTLRDQIIYPDNVEDMRNKHVNDNHLEKFLEIVQLTYLKSREKGFDAVQDWMDVLSGGEKQRIAMARLFYHAPQFAILDECTSAVSVDVEGSMYQYCRKAGITLFTVSHRKSLWQHHDYYLHMDGRGSYEFKTIDENTREFGS